MMRLLQEFVQNFTDPGKPGRCLIVVATPLEAGPVLAALGSHAKIEPWVPVAASDFVDLLCTGVGKANASGATAHSLARNSYKAVLNLGICGVLPVQDAPKIGSLIFASVSAFADEGVETPVSWRPLADLGFPAAVGADEILPDSRLRDYFSPLVDRIGAVATVSTCSGTNTRASEIARRLGPAALAEAMEGAAVGLAAARAGVPFAELRAVSNTTGNRDAQQWEIGAALARIESLARAMLR